MRWRASVLGGVCALASFDVLDAHAHGGMPPGSGAALLVYLRARRARLL